MKRLRRVLANLRWWIMARASRPDHRQMLELLQREYERGRRVGRLEGWHDGYCEALRKRGR